MPNAAEAIRIYRELAELHQQRDMPQQRDRFLVLAADAALAAGQGDEAERLRHRLLQLNPHHLLKPYASFAEATRAGDVQSYITALRQSVPWEAAERMLASLREEVSAKPAGEPQPQIFRVRPEEAPPPPARPRQVPPPHARPVQPQAVPLAEPIPPPPPKPRAAPPPRAVPRPELYSEEPNQLPARRPRTLDSDEPAAVGGNLVPSILFLLLLLAGVAMAVYAFAKPFFTL
jgi:hypothetical protein